MVVLVNFFFDGFFIGICVLLMNLIMLGKFLSLKYIFLIFCIFGGVGYRIIVFNK